ncbi:MAG: hypothetical protein U0230_18000 [Polyangiales bacterium]
MPKALVPLFAASLLVFSGCLLQNMSPTERLRDAVIGYNEAARWGRMDIAQQQVDGPLQGDFRRVHSRWGRLINIADQEILAVNAAGEGDDTQAVSVVAHRWYEQDATYLHETTLRQTWKKSRNTFLLTSEVVIDGDPALFAPMPGYIDLSAGPLAPPSDGGVPGDAGPAADGGVAAPAAPAPAPTTATEGNSAVSPPGAAP